MTEGERPRGVQIARYVGVTIVAALALFWIYVLFIAPPAPEDKLSDPAFARAAEGVCSTTVDGLRTASLVDQQAPTPQARADLVVRTDARLASMVGQLRALDTGSDNDARAISAWLDDWDQWLRDRAVWVGKLNNGENVPFDEKARPGGQPYSKALNEFAKTNAMPACQTPYGV